MNKDNISSNLSKFTRKGPSGKSIGKVFMDEMGWVNIRKLKSILKEFNKSVQDWYDEYILGIDNSLNRPKCPICGKECKFINISLGYNMTCSFLHGRILGSRNDSEHHSEVMKKLYENPESRKRTSDSIRNAYNVNPEYREKVSKGTKEGMSKPESKIKRSRSHRELWRNPTERMLNPKNSRSSNKSLRYSGIKSSVISKYDPLSKIYFDSNWEKVFYYNCTLDERIVNITRWRIPIMYVRPSDGLVHSHLPDFLVEYSNGVKEIIEIKPKFLTDDPDTKSKIESATSYSFLYGYEYRVVTEEIMDFSKSIINKLPI